MSYEDTAVLDRAYAVTPQQDAAAVCTVLRWAIRARAGEPAARALCEMLGVDLASAVGSRAPALPVSHVDPPAAVRVSDEACRWLRAWLLEHPGATVLEVACAAAEAGVTSSRSVLGKARRAIGATVHRYGCTYRWAPAGAPLSAGTVSPGEDEPRPAKGCGTYAGYRRHIDFEDGQPCEPCREAKREYVRRHRPRWREAWLRNSLRERAEDRP